jgi:hypothetical protein
LRFQFAVLLLLGIFFTGIAQPAAKVHVITFGKWMVVPWNGVTGADGNVPTIKICALHIDGPSQRVCAGCFPVK